MDCAQPGIAPTGVNKPLISMEVSTIKNIHNMACRELRQAFPMSNETVISSNR